MTPKPHWYHETMFLTTVLLFICNLISSTRSYKIYILCLSVCCCCHLLVEIKEWYWYAPFRWWSIRLINKLSLSKFLFLLLVFRWGANRAKRGILRTLSSRYNLISWMQQVLFLQTWKYIPIKFIHLIGTSTCQIIFSTMHSQLHYTKPAMGNH